MSTEDQPSEDRSGKGAANHPHADEFTPASERHGIDYEVEPRYPRYDFNGNPLTPEQRDQLMDYRVDVDNHVETNWKSAGSREVWKDVFQEMQTAQKEAEWRSVLDEDTDRKAAIIHLTNYNREKWLKLLSRNNLIYEDIRYSKPYAGYSHKHYPTSIDDPERHTYAVIAEDEDILHKMKEAELEMEGPEKHRIKGELLGFPDCCTEFFNQVWLADSQIDPMYEAACNTPSAEPIDGDHAEIHIKDPNAGINPLWRYVGARFITHMPCSFECEHSVEIARDRHRIMHENGAGEAADAMAEWLSTPFEWSANNALARVSNKHMIARSHTSSYLKKKRIVWDEEIGGRDVVEDFTETGETAGPGAFS